jgi:hypothetical protein
MKPYDVFGSSGPASPYRLRSAAASSPAAIAEAPRKHGSQWTGLSQRYEPAHSFDESSPYLNKGCLFLKRFPYRYVLYAAMALAAARTAAAEQRVPGHTEVIEYEDENGHWHTETASGRDRPETDVQDTN